LTACVSALATKSVSPSGRACATNCAPTAPFAPGRLSMITGWPRIGCIAVASARETTSVAPPAFQGTTMRTGPSG
jgi:hypothetical protein